MQLGSSSRIPARVAVVGSVQDSQVEAVSDGKQKSKAAGHDEAAWQENRRADIVYPSR